MKESFPEFTENNLASVNISFPQGYPGSIHGVGVILSYISRNNNAFKANLILRNMPDLICPVVSPLCAADFRAVIGNAVSRGRGANSIFILGTTGEFDLFTVDEKKGFIDVAVDEIAKQRASLEVPEMKLTLGVGIMAESERASIELARYAERQGADYLVVMPVYMTRRFGRCTRRGSTGAARRVLEATDKIDVVLYTYAAKTNGKDLLPRTLEKLSVEERIKALKVSTQDRVLVERYKAASKGRIKIYVGNEIMGLRTPYDGIVSGSTNVLAAAWGRATRRGEEDIQGGRVADRLTDFQKFYSGNPVGAFHYMLEKLGVVKQGFRQENRVSASQAGSLDYMMTDGDFKTFVSWNQKKV